MSSEQPAGEDFMTHADLDGSHDGAIAAEGWQRGATLRADLRSITEQMLDLAGIGSGHRVLDVVLLHEGSVEAIASVQEQDDEFCRRLRIAIEMGSEFCPTTVSTKPCTSRPILNYTRPETGRR
jgi:hypothetical protein